MPHVRGDHRAQRRQESQPRPDHPGRGGEGGHHPRGGKQQQQQQDQEKMLLLPKSPLYSHLPNDIVWSNCCDRMDIKLGCVNTKYCM